MSGRADAAIPVAEATIRLSPNDTLIGPFTARLAMANFFLQHHDEAVEWAHRAMRYPNISWPVHMILIAAFSHLGDVSAAREAVDNVLRFRPGTGITMVRDTLPVSDAAYMDHLIDGLRAAGLPE